MNRVEQVLIEWRGRVFGVIEGDHLRLEPVLERADEEDPWRLWALALAQQAFAATVEEPWDSEQAARAARAALLPAPSLVACLGLTDDPAALAGTLGLPEAVVRDRLADVDVAVLRAGPGGAFPGKRSV